MTSSSQTDRIGSFPRALFGTAFKLLGRKRAKLRAQTLITDIANRGPLLEKAVKILELRGSKEMEKHFSGFWGLFPNDMAAILTDIAKLKYPLEPGVALELFRRASELDPKAYRKKMLAFRLFDQGQTREAASILSQIADEVELGPSEIRKFADIRFESSLLSSPDLLRDSMDALPGLLEKGDFGGLVLLRATLLNASHGDAGLFLADLILLLCYNAVGAHHASVELVDAILARISSDIAAIHACGGADNCRRFIEAAAQALTKTGRHADALALVNTAMNHFGIRPGNLRFRARLFWPYHPEQTLQDFEKYGEIAPLSPSERLLRARLQQTSPEKALAECSEGEFLLFAANGYLGREDVGSYARSINCYLAGQGLLPAFPEDLTAGVDLWRSLESAAAERVTSQGPLVSVIMTTYNAAETLDYAVASVLGQTHRNVELLIIDDASSDRTPELLLSWQNRDPRIKIFLSTQNQGTFVSKNNLIDEAAGEYVTFHDADDWAHPERIALHVDALAGNLEIKATMSDWLRIEPSGRIEYQRWSMAYRHRNLCSLLVRRKLFEEIGYFDRVTFGADTEMWARICRLFGRNRTCHIEKCLTFGLLRKGSLTQGGAGIFDDEDFSLARSTYRQSWFHWHARSESPELALPRVLPSRRFWAPDAMLAPSHPEPPGISLTDIPVPRRRFST